MLTKEIVLFEGAEAKIIKIDDNTIKKLRTAKTYRLPIIDEKLRKTRNKREFKILKKLYENKINVPKVFEINEKEFYFTFEFLNGNILKDVLNEKFLFLAFEEIKKMHSLDIVHGDLTSLNMIEKNNKIFLIDFGLSEFSKKIEEKAVDLNLFFNCIKNEHPIYYKYKKDLEDKYLELEFGIRVINRLKNIQKRGRNK